MSMDEMKEERDHNYTLSQKQKSQSNTKRGNLKERREALKAMIADTDNY